MISSFPTARQRRRQYKSHPIKIGKCYHLHLACIGRLNVIGDRDGFLYKDRIDSDRRGSVSHGIGEPLVVGARSGAVDNARCYLR